LLGFVDADNPNAIKAKQIQDWVDEGVVGYWGTSADVREQLLLADCVVLPSYREGTPRSLLEAAAMGRPLIATDVPGCREVVHNGINGLLCQPSDANDLATQMISMLALTDKKIQEMGNASRQLMELNFGEQRVIEQYRKALNKLI
jgi:glycosyltransferase involved in cell wall biosynthesis